MSELSQIWAVNGGNIRLYCPKYSMYVTDCTHKDECGLCRKEKYVKRKPKTNTCIEVSDVKKGSNNERIGPRNRKRSTKKTKKPEKIDDRSGLSRPRKTRRKRRKSVL